jgi:hypothetical protein
LISSCLRSGRFTPNPGHQSSQDLPLQQRPEIVTFN